MVSWLLLFDGSAFVFTQYSHAFASGVVCGIGLFFSAFMVSVDVASYPSRCLLTSFPSCAFQVLITFLVSSQS